MTEADYIDDKDNIDESTYYDILSKKLSTIASTNQKKKKKLP